MAEAIPSRNKLSPYFTVLNKVTTLNRRFQSSPEEIEPWLQIESGLPTSFGASQKIFRATLTVGFFTGLATLGSTVKELLVAKWFGRGDPIDAFLIAFLLPFTVVRVVAGSIDSAFIPPFIRLRESVGREAAQRLFSNVMACALGLLFGISILLGLLPSYYLPLLGSGFDVAKLKLASHLLYLLLLYVVLSGVATIWTAVLNAREQFALPAFSPLLSPLAMIAFIIGAGKALGILALAWGTVTGALLEVIVLGWALNAQGLTLMPQWHGMDPQLRRVARQYLPMVAGSFLIAGTALVDQSMAAMLKPGSIAALNYGYKLTGAISGIAGWALYSAVLPYFSQMVARGDWAGCREALKTHSRTTLLVTGPIAVILTVFSRPLVKILFERGAFTPADTAMVAGVQAFYAIQLPFFALAVVFQRLLSSLGRNDWVMWGAAANLILTVLLNLVLMRMMGLIGIALSRSVLQLLSCVLFCVFALRELSQASPVKVT